MDASSGVDGIATVDMMDVEQEVRKSLHASDAHHVFQTTIAYM
jgi:hypothetical protein